MKHTLSLNLGDSRLRGNSRGLSTARLFFVIALNDEFIAILHLKFGGFTPNLREFTPDFGVNMVKMRGFSVNLRLNSVLLNENTAAPNLFIVVWGCFLINDRKKHEWSFKSVRVGHVFNYLVIIVQLLSSLEGLD